MLTYDPTRPFNDATYGPSSGVDGAGSEQMNPFFWLKKALIESRKEQFFTPLANTINMPKHFGKTIKVYEYVPLLDDRNVNDQGIDASGAKIVTAWSAIDADGNVISSGHADEATAIASDPAAVGARQDGGNLYGSSKDIGTIEAKLPTLSEEGGRVNRVGFTRLSREGSLFRFGFFHEFTQESIDFDSDEALMDHLARELTNGAVQMTEAILQKDLLAAAGTVVYPGAATAANELTADNGVDTALDPQVADDALVLGVIDYDDLVRLDQILTDNRTPRQTKVITGSRLQDTRTLPAARVAFVGSELVPHLKRMTDPFGNPAFIAVQHYAEAGATLNGEIGSIDQFRIVQVPEMLHWAGAGANDATGGGTNYRTSGGKYDVFPFLVVGDDAFSTIGFQTDGKSVKFKVITHMPGDKTAGLLDPYGEKGFSSIKWYYGMLTKRPERIGLIKTLAPV